MVEIWIEVGTAIFNNLEAKIGVSSFEQSGEDNAAGCNSEKDQRINFLRTKDHRKISAGKGTNPMLCDRNLTLF